jgi:hypothetical protein
MGTFPFGAPVLPRGESMPDRHSRVVVIGAYPSALHVRWTPPEGFGPAVAATPVDNEPTPFWNGDGQKDPFERWKATRLQAEWGSVDRTHLDGSSGRDIADRWLQPLVFTLEDAFITDCLCAARASIGVGRRVAERYAPMAEALGAPAADLRPHPSESEIVAEALADHAGRLFEQLRAACPEVVVTLGNAAGRVVAVLAGLPDHDGILRADTYGAERPTTLGGRTFAWRALVHPATPKVWAERHARWIESIGP